MKTAEQAKPTILLVVSLILVSLSICISNYQLHVGDCTQIGHVDPATVCVCTPGLFCRHTVYPVPSSVHSHLPTKTNATLVESFY